MIEINKYRLSLANNLRYKWIFIYEIIKSNWRINRFKGIRRDYNINIAKSKIYIEIWDK